MNASGKKADPIAIEPRRGPIWAAARLLLQRLQKLRLAYRRVTGRQPLGVHAIAVTPRNHVILVKLTYAEGWRLPGGGMKAGEEPAPAMIRELVEEIGLRRFGSFELVRDFPQSEEGGRLYLFRDVECEPRRTIEIDAVWEFALDELPAGLAPATVRSLRAAFPACRRKECGRSAGE